MAKPTETKPNNSHDTGAAMMTVGCIGDKILVNFVTGTGSGQIAFDVGEAEKIVRILNRHIDFVKHPVDDSQRSV